MTDRGRILTCDRCGAPTAFLAAACAYCQAPLTWGAVPEPRPGAVLFAYDFTRGELLPNMTELQGARVEAGRGVVVIAPAGRLMYASVRAYRCDAVLRLTAVANEFAGIGIEARATWVGKTRTAYCAEVVPALRSCRMRRVLNTEKGSYGEVLRAPEVVRALRRTGERNVVELRYIDSLMTLHVNGTQLASFVDARYGFGDMGFSVRGFGPGGSVLLERFEVLEVV